MLNKLSFVLSRRFCTEFFKDVNKKKGVFSYDVSGVGELPKKQFYKARLSKEQLAHEQKKAFLKFQQDLEQKALEEKKGIRLELKKEDLKVDELWGSEVPQRVLDRISMKELNWHSRDVGYLSEGDELIEQFLVNFSRPFTLHEGSVVKILDDLRILQDAWLKQQGHLFQEDYDFFHYQKIFISQSEDFRSLLEDLKTQILNLNYKLLPDLGLKLSFDLRYRQLGSGVWESFLQVLEQNIYHYSVSDLAKLRYALGGIFPVLGEARLHKQILDLVKQDLRLCNESELLHVLWSYRTLSKDKIQSEVVQEFKRRQKDLARAYLDEKQPNKDFYGDLVYTYAACRLKEQFRVKTKLQSAKEEAGEFLKIFCEDIKKSVSNMSFGGLARLSLGLGLLRREDYADIYFRLEKAILKRSEQEQPKASQVYQIIYSFSKILDGKNFGSETFFQKLFEIAQKKENWEKFSDTQKSRIFFSFTNCQKIPEKTILQTFLPWAQQNMHKFNHLQLSNVGICLAYLKYKEKETWIKFVRNVAQQKLVVPYNYYFQFKQIRYYLDNLFPQWNYTPYEQACQNSEFYFNTLRIKKTYSNDELLNFGTLLQKELQIQFIYLLEFDNLYVIDFAIMPQKVAILLQGNKNSTFETSQPNHAFLLKKFIIEQNGWTVVTVNWKEFQNADPQKRILNLQTQIQQAVEKANQIYKEQEKDRWDATHHRIIEITKRQMLPSEFEKLNNQN